MSGDPHAVLAAAKKQLHECDQEIADIRSVLRTVGSSSDDEPPNSLTVQWINPPPPELEDDDDNEVRACVLFCLLIYYTFLTEAAPSLTNIICSHAFLSFLLLFLFF